MIHGGQLKEAMKQFPNAVTPWVDLSTGINPYAYPFLPIPIERLTQLPSIEDEAFLRKIAAIRYGVKDKNHVAVAPGTQVLISLLPYIFETEQVCILCPTYMEHIASWQQAGVTVHQVTTLEDFMHFALQKQTTGVICNPNNPDGCLFKRDQMSEILNYWEKFHNHIVIDEAFMDFSGQSMARYLPHPALTILRSFGKTYGLAGVRLGFLLSNHHNIQKIQKMLGPWSLSGTALHIGLQALQDEKWLSSSKQQLLLQVGQLDQLFMQYGCQIVGGTYLYRLIEYVNAQDLWKYLASQGIWVRKFTYNSRWLRFGLPHRNEWERVNQTIKDYFKTQY